MFYTTKFILELYDNLKVLLKKTVVDLLTSFYEKILQHFFS